MVRTQIWVDKEQESQGRVDEGVSMIKAHCSSESLTNKKTLKTIISRKTKTKKLTYSYLSKWDSRLCSNKISAFNQCQTLSRLCIIGYIEFYHSILPFQFYFNIIASLLLYKYYNIVDYIQKQLYEVLTDITLDLILV